MAAKKHPKKSDTVKSATYSAPSKKSKKSVAEVVPEPRRTLWDRVSKGALAVTAIVSAAAAVAAVLVAYQALEQSRLEYAEAHPIKTLSDTFLAEELRDTDPAARPGVKTLGVTMALQNFYATTVDGCLTYWEPVNSQFRPVLFFPSINEINAETWSLKPGEINQSYVEIELDPAEWGQLAYVDVWFECEDPAFTSLGAIVDVNLATGEFLTPDQTLNRMSPLSSADRGEYIQAVINDQ